MLRLQQGGGGSKEGMKRRLRICQAQMIDECGYIHLEEKQRIINIKFALLWNFVAKSRPENTSR